MCAEVVLRRSLLVLALPDSQVRIQVERYNSRVWLWRVWLTLGSRTIDKGAASTRRGALAMAEHCVQVNGLSAHRERTPASPEHAAECEGGAGDLSGEQP